VSEGGQQMVTVRSHSHLMMMHQRKQEVLGRTNQVKVTLRLTVSQFWCPAPPDIYYSLTRSCFCRTPSLTRGRVCLSYMLLALTSAVFLGSESLGTRDHKQLIAYFPSTTYWASDATRTAQKTRRPVVLLLAAGTCLPSRCLETTGGGGTQIHRPKNGMIS
jgi:hypothetical protein